jgi:chromosome segregation ATPase
MKKDVIETKADQLVEYIYAKGEVVSAIASEELNIPLDQIEEWAVPLEENHLIRVRYSPIHGMILISRPIGEKELDFKVSSFKGRRNDLKSQSKKLERMLAEQSEIIPELNYNLKELEKAYEKKLKEAKGKKSRDDAAKLLKELNIFHVKLQAYEEELEELGEEKAELNKTIDEFKKEVVNVDMRVKAAEKSNMFGDYYRFLSDVERRAVKTKKTEDKFAEKTNGLRKRVNHLMPQVHMKYKELHKKSVLDSLKGVFSKK